jgi:hypothetical protein
MVGPEGTTIAKSVLIQVPQDIRRSLQTLILGQIMVTTNAHIGNYGTSLDLESKSVKISALVCARRLRPHATDSLLGFLQRKT